jgi:hypothetical protein
MQLSKIITEIDQEIGRLKQARALLAGSGYITDRKPRSIVKTAKSADAPAKLTKKRNLTPEGRKRIAEAVRRRWELQRKGAAK